MSQTLVHIQYSTLVLSMVTLCVNFWLLWRTKALYKRAIRMANSTEQLERDFVRLLQEINEVANYAISVGGEPVAEELHRLTDIANETASKMRRRNAAGDYDA